MAAAERMIRDLDQGKAEIQIEVEVIEAGRDRIRDLGITPATVIVLRQHYARNPDGHRFQSRP